VKHSVPQLQISVRTPSKREVIYIILKLDPSKAADMLLPLFQEIWQRQIFGAERRNSN
jgi:hypothetical protein